jgi:hypothetical protein
VRMFLLGGAGGDTMDALARVLSEQGAPASAIRGLGGLSAAALQAVNREVAAVIDRLLELDLGELLLAGWRRYSELTKAAQPTLAHPGSQEMVVLASHRVVSTHHPRPSPPPITPAHHPAHHPRPSPPPITPASTCSSMRRGRTRSSSR